MLNRLGPGLSPGEAACTPDLFGSGLEFNPPAHGTWNIVHIGMLVPESHQIYICAVNCMRGVVLTAAEMGAQDRFSCVILKESDIVRGTVEQVTLEGIIAVLEELADKGHLPRAVIVFPVCTHLFLGVSMARVYRELECRFPGVNFVRAFMDPISRKRLVPDRRLRRAMYEHVEPAAVCPRMAALVGSDFALDPDADLRMLLERAGWQVASVHDCTTYDEFLGLGHAQVIICTFPGGDLGGQALAKRLGRPYHYLPSSFSYDEIRAQLDGLAAALGVETVNHNLERSRCEAELALTRQACAAFDVAIDALAHPRPLGLAHLLVEGGLNVTEVFMDAISPEESHELDWLAIHAPKLTIRPMVAPEMRVASRERMRPTLAIGQRASWFCGTDHFVNIVQGMGLWGYAGIRSLARLMREAAETKRDARDLIVRKGLGCESLI